MRVRLAPFRRDRFRVFLKSDLSPSDCSFEAGTSRPSSDLARLSSHSTTRWVSVSSFSQIELPLLDLNRGVRQLRPRQQQTAQIRGPNPEFVLGRALVDRDELNPRTKTPIPKTLTARQTALEEPNDACAPTAGAQEKRPRTAVGETHQ